MAGTTTLIAAGTDGATAVIRLQPGVKALLTGFGFAGNGDILSVLVSYDDGTTFVQCYDDLGVAVEIGGSGATQPRNPVMIEGPGVYQVKRTATTTDSIGVAMTQQVNT